MRQQSAFIPTMREVPADAEAISHQLLVKGGFIRQLSAGVYSFLPLGRRVLRKVEEIVREEMERTGAQEVLLPALQPADLWQQSGRYAVYGPELMRLRDRGEREFVLGPTHEEVITTLVGQEISSFRRLPVTLFQIQTKFRDERRPRFGLLRCKEFVMKDAYSFAADWDTLDDSYKATYDAYFRIFERCKLQFRAVEADAGAIGGEGGTHEFMAIAESGEDDVVICSHCDYAANLEKAAGRKQAGSSPVESSAAATPSTAKFHTPGLRSIEDLTAALGIGSHQLIKTLIFMADDQPAAVLVRGDRTLNETKVKNALHAVQLRLADHAEVSAITGAAAGFAGPVGLDIPLLVDEEVAAMTEAITGANETDFHMKHVVPGRDYSLSLSLIGDYRNVEEGEACPSCGDGRLRIIRGIEIGHVFKLGTKYSEKLSARFVDANGDSQPIIMGCYGIGITRLLSAVIEQHHDENGMIWPVHLAPYQVHIIPVSHLDAGQMNAANELYEELGNAGIEVLLDDRPERLGVKLKDADLIGIPLRIVIGKGITEGNVEWKLRAHEGPAEQRSFLDAKADVLSWAASLGKL